MPALQGNGGARLEGAGTAGVNVDVTAPLSGADLNTLVQAQVSAKVAADGAASAKLELQDATAAAVQSNDPALQSLWSESACIGCQANRRLADGPHRAALEFFELEARFLRAKRSSRLRRSPTCRRSGRSILSSPARMRSATWYSTASPVG